MNRLMKEKGMVNDMQFDEEEFTPNSKVSLSAMMIIISFAIVVSLGIVVLSNSKTSKHSSTDQMIKQEETEMVTEDKIEVGQSNLRAEDLDFWDMYPESKQEDVFLDASEPVIEAKEPVIEEEDPATDGKHVSVMLEDGSVSWVPIDSNLPANPYIDTQFQKEAEQLKYYSNNRLTSVTGIDLSYYSGEVDFEKIKKAGIQYVMLKIGSRGYQTGELTIDEKFKTYLVQAKAQGLYVGGYFESQAINEAEALEEVNFIAQTLSGETLKYPIAVRMNGVNYDQARTDNLTVEMRTSILKTFMDGIKGTGNTAMLYGDKDFLITQVNLNNLTNYEVWLCAEGDLPEYPYWFTMWQYDNAVNINGISVSCPISISLVDYAAR